MQPPPDEIMQKSWEHFSHEADMGVRGIGSPQQRRGDPPPDMKADFSHSVLSRSRLNRDRPCEHHISHNTNNRTGLQFRGPLHEGNRAVIVKGQDPFLSRFLRASGAR